MNSKFSSIHHRTGKQHSKKQLSMHAIQANDAKLTEENMFKKLLHPPKKNQNKLLLASNNNQARKYDPHFPKPEPENLLKQNLILKKEKHEDRKTIMNLRIQNEEMRKKIQKFEKIKEERMQDLIEKEKHEKSYYIHTQILKKKIHQLQAKYLSAEAEIKEIRKLPNVSIHEEYNVEKQHLLAETIRLKAILKSYEQVQEQQQEENNSEKFPNKFLRMLKEENQKLKASIRLLENDKVLMKSRHNIQNKQINDLKKELESIRQKFILKQAEVEKLLNQNKNLLFKKASQFKFQEEEREKKKISEMKKIIEQLNSQEKRILDENQFLLEDNQRLKEKQKQRNNEIQEKEKIYQLMKMEISDLQNKYEARIKSLQMTNSHGRVYNSLSGQSILKYSKSDDFNQKGEEIQGKDKYIFCYQKQVKFDDLQLPLLKLWKTRDLCIVNKIQDIFLKKKKGKNKKQLEQQLTIEQLYRYLRNYPLKLSKIQSRKLVKYIFQDTLNAVQEGEEQSSDDEVTVEVSLVICMIESGINKLIECVDKESIMNNWKCLLIKSKRFLKELQIFSGKIQTKQGEDPLLTKDQFINLLLKNTRNSIDREDLTYICLHSFDPFNSKNQIVLNKKQLLKFFYELSIGKQNSFQNGKKLSKKSSQFENFETFKDLKSNSQKKKVEEKQKDNQKVDSDQDSFTRALAQICQ